MGPELKNQRIAARWMGGALASLIAACVIGLFVIWYQSREIVIRAPSSARIPEGASWHGGRDGGTWIELVDSRDDEKFHLRIYRDGTGQLESDSWFVLSENCRGEKVPAGSFHDRVQGYDGKRVSVTPSDGRQHCFLRQVASVPSKEPPVYYRINRQRVSQEEFERLKKSLVVSETFSEGELTRPTRGKRVEHGFVHIWEATDPKTRKRYQFSIEAFEDETNYSLQAVKK